jgi:VWFA-related protein
MFRTRALIVVATLALAASLAAARQERGFSIGADLVELDAVVIDRKGKPVINLTQSDFVVKEDGKEIPLTTFEEVSPARVAAADRARSIVLLLDEAGIPASGTQVVRQIARAFLESTSPLDEVAVVRLHNWRDEPFGDRRVAEFRIEEYYAATQPFNGVLTQEEVLRRVADLADQLQVNSQKRKIIVCIGSPFVCNVEEPARVAPRNLWGKWVAALRATALANVSFYVVVPSRMNLYGASYHYVLGYWPPEGRSRPLHSLEVKVKVDGAKVITRMRRAE